MDFAIYSVSAGKVLYSLSASDGSAYGNRVYIRNDDGTVCMYGHLASVCVSVGDTVNARETVGIMGSSGSDNKHLHLSFFDTDVKDFVAKNATDPEQYIIKHGMPCKTKATNPYGSELCNRKLKYHEGIDFSGLEKNEIEDTSIFQAIPEYYQRKP